MFFFFNTHLKKKKKSFQKKLSERYHKSTHINKIHRFMMSLMFVFPNLHVGYSCNRTIMF